MTSARSIELRVNALGQLILRDAEGAEHVGVEPVRMFPISEPGGWISFCDSSGREVASIAAVEELPAESRRVLEAELAHREFLPKITEITSVDPDLTPEPWRVVTDHGPVEFLVNSEEDIRILGPARILIVDVHGARYLIPDVHQLDRASRRILDRYL